ncbi:exoribonuclease family protein [Phaeosphaeriaceae sp. PMI808]|nr:exoribonuclease family protein [Phaeosphaeriaceae sp. PMI808]
MAMNADRRRNNGPPGGTAPPVYARTIREPEYLQSLRPTRSRGPSELRGIFLQTSIIPSASGSAYLEIPSSSNVATSTLVSPTSTLKITASVQGPKPLPRSAPFSPSLLLTTTVKFAPFATRHRRGYIRDSTERDLGVHLDTALRGVVIGERWPKSGVEVVVTILEGDEDGWWGDDETDGSANGSGWGLLNVLAGCITVASAAITDAGIDCVDVVTGGVAAIVRNPDSKDQKALATLLDPCPAEHKEIVAACAVAYLASRDEITELWLKGDVGEDVDALMEGATHAAAGSLTVVKEVLLEALQAKFQAQLSDNDTGLKRKAGDVDMAG